MNKIFLFSLYSYFFVSFVNYLCFFIAFMLTDICIFATGLEHILNYIMCGIVSCIGKQDAYPVLIKGLNRLEYRGYDSAGIALIDKKRRLNLYKVKGKVSDREVFISPKCIFGTVGIARTRWAIYKELCQADAHLLFSSSAENLALIHNGIIENYIALKKKLRKEGNIFKSSKDTKVFVQLISNYLYLFTVVRLVRHKVIVLTVIASDKNSSGGIVVKHKGNPSAVRKDGCFPVSDVTLGMEMEVFSEGMEK